MRKTWLLKLRPVSSVSPTDSSTQGVVSGSRGSSKMLAICLALVMYLRSCSGRKLHSLRKMGVIRTAGLFAQWAGPDWTVGSGVRLV